MLLYFAYADYEEGRLKYDKVHQIYCKYLDIQDIDPTLVCCKFYAKLSVGKGFCRPTFNT